MADLNLSQIITRVCTKLQLYFSPITHNHTISDITGLPSASNTTPNVNGTGAPGSSTAYSRADHVHPTDTTRQEVLVSGTNIKTINNNSLLGEGNLVIDTSISPATTTNIGGVKPGTGLLIQNDGTLSLDSHTHDASNITSGTLLIANGGTGAADAVTALTNLGAAAATHTHTPTSIGAANAIHTHDATEIDNGTLNSDRLPTVPIAKGGTGQTTTKGAQYGLLNDCTEATGTSTDDTYIMTVLNNASAEVGFVGKKKLSNLWTYIANKIRSTFGFSSANVLPIANGGTGATDAATARTNINAAASSHTHNYLPLAGGEVTGTLKLTRTTDASGTADNKPALMVGDMDGQHLEIDGNEIMSKASGTTTATLNINLDGGATHFGGLIRTHGAEVSMESKNLTDGTTPGSAADGNGRIRFYDNASTAIGGVCPRFETDGRQKVRLYTNRNINSTTIYNVIDLGIDENGNRTVGVTDPAAWRTGLSITPANIGAAASSHTHSYLPLSGGTMTGPIAIKDSTAMPRATGTGWYPIVMDSFGDGGELKYMNPADLLTLIGAAASDHNHAASDITSGSFGVARGGTGRNTLTSGSYLIGNGTSAVTLKTPAQVLSDIGAAPDSATKSSATSQITMDSGMSLTNIYTAKAGAVLTVGITFKSTSAMTSGTAYDIGTLTSGLRPYGKAHNCQTGAGSVDDAWITTGGVVKYRPGANKAANTSLQIDATYVVA